MNTQNKEKLHSVMAVVEKHLGERGKEILGIGGLALLGIVARGVVNHLSGNDAAEKVKIF